MIYIVIMLFVFSAGIASLMIIYMKKVKEMKHDFLSFLFITNFRNKGTKKMLIYTRFMWRLPGIVLGNSVSAKFLYLFLMNFINPLHYKHSFRHKISGSARSGNLCPSVFQSVTVIRFLEHSMYFWLKYSSSSLSSLCKLSLKLMHVKVGALNTSSCYVMLFISQGQIQRVFKQGTICQQTCSPGRI